MDLEKKVRELIDYPREANWFEFKENWYEPNGIGEYISSLSNVAALEGQEYGYLVWGIIFLYDLRFLTESINRPPCIRSGNLAIPVYCFRWIRCLNMAMC